MATKYILDAEAVKAELRRRNISYSDLAAICNVSPSYIGKVMLGMNNRWSGTTDRIKQAIADSIEVDINDLEIHPKVKQEKTSSINIALLQKNILESFPSSN